jgi:hypothetical protein
MNSSKEWQTEDDPKKYLSACCQEGGKERGGESEGIQDVAESTGRRTVWLEKNGTGESDDVTCIKKALHA